MRGEILCATIFLFGMLGIGQMKMWYWMQMNRNALAREIKRLELQVATLVQAVSSS